MGERIGFGFYHSRGNRESGGGGLGLRRWGGVMSLCVVSLDYLCIWPVQVSVYCASPIPAHLRCT